jgi:hypothetical protein
MAAPRTRKSQVQFNKGELSPKLDARTDTEVYQGGCRQLKNFLPMVQGGITKRKGFEFIAESKFATESKPARVLRFQFSQADAMILEFGDLYVRFFTRTGPVMDPGAPSEPYELVTPYTSAQAFAIQVAQVNDVMYITHPLHAPRKLTRLDLDAWTLTTVVFDLPPFLDENVGNTTLTTSNATVGTGRTLTASSALFNNPDHIGSFWRIGHRRDTDTEELALTANGTSGTVRTLGGWSVNTYGTWTATLLVQLSLDNGTTWETVRRYTSKADANFSDAGEQVGDEALYRLKVEDWVSSSGTPAPRAVFTAQSGFVYGLVKVTGVTSTTVATVTVVNALFSTAATKVWAEGAFSELRGYPTSLCFFQQRLWFGGTSYQPQTFWGSVIDDYENFTTGTNDDDGLAFTLASEERNQIVWMVGQKKLVLGTTGGIWSAYGDELEAAITATKPPLVLKQQQYPAAYQRALLVNGAILFIQSSGRKLRELVFDGSQGVFTAGDLTAISDQIGAGGIVTPSYQQNRDSFFWACTGLGKLISLAYEKEQSVLAWSQHDTDGIFESVDTIKGLIDDEVWVCVRREIDGVWKRFIERMTGFYNPSVDYPPDIVIEPGIACATAASSGGQGFQEITVTLGTGTGTVQLNYNAIGVPDRFVVKWNGNTVIDTGYRGNSSYDSALAALGLPPVEGPGAGTVTFEKTSAFPVNATVEVYGPLPGTAWSFTLGCPDGGTPPLPVGTTYPGAEVEKTFVDSCKIYLSPSLNVTGLDHLEGATVKILADGIVLPDQVVTGGGITLSAAANVVHVGLQYEAVMQPMRLDSDPNLGSTMQQVKRIHKLGFRVLDAGFPFRISTTDNPTEVTVPLNNQTADPTKIPTAGNLFSGDVVWNLNADYDRDASFTIHHDAPLPITLLAATTFYQVSDTT